MLEILSPYIGMSLVTLFMVIMWGLPNDENDGWILEMLKRREKKKAEKAKRR